MAVLRGRCVPKHPRVTFDIMRLIWTRGGRAAAEPDPDVFGEALNAYCAMIHDHMPPGEEEAMEAAGEKGKRVVTECMRDGLTDAEVVMLLDAECRAFEDAPSGDSRAFVVTSKSRSIGREDLPVSGALAEDCEPSPLDKALHGEAEKDTAVSSLCVLIHAKSPIYAWAEFARGSAWYCLAVSLACMAAVRDGRQMFIPGPEYDIGTAISDYESVVLGGAGKFTMCAVRAEVTASSLGALTKPARA